METCYIGEDMKKARAYYAHLGQFEKRMRNKMRNASRVGDVEKADALWQKVLEIKQRRTGTDYYKQVVSQSR